MANSYFQFKQFTIQQDKCAMKVTTDSCLFGAWVAEIINSEKSIIKKCLDIGTGTGLLSLMLAQKNPSVTIDTAEIDTDTAKQAAENIAASLWYSRIQVYHADIIEFVPEKKYDVIICNPPFYENELKSKDSKKNKAHHDESLLLKPLLHIIRDNLADEGSYFLMLPYKRLTDVKSELAGQSMQISHICSIRQSPIHEYFRIIISGGLQKTEALNNETTESEMTIAEKYTENKQVCYTPQFKELLSPYYLYL